MKIKEFELAKSWYDEEKTKNENMDRMLSWYRRGAIQIDELIYNIAQIDNEKDFKELAELFLDILEQNTKRERKDVRHKLLEIIIRRLQK